jgi:LemA protein
MGFPMQKTALFGCLGALVLVGIVAALVGVGGYNKLVGLSQNVDSKWSQVENQYQRRADLIPNLVNTVSGAANFEKSTLTEVINARANATKVTIDPSKAPTDPAQLEQYQRAQDQLSGALSRLLVVAEKYPELKATQNFRDLQAQIEGTENRIAVARQDFNNAARDYNTAKQRFPTVLYANLFGFKDKQFFRAKEGADTAPTVSFPSFGPTPAPVPSPR